MAKLYFKYGTMGSSKTAQALMTCFNYEEKGRSVAFIKPSIDNRDGEEIVKSRIGLSRKAFVLQSGRSIYELFPINIYDAIIVDEAQFLTFEQIEELKTITTEYDIPVFCFGLKTNYLTKMFEGSKRLLEISDSISEIKSICKCGKKAIINARIDNNGNVITSGKEVLIGSNESYEGMCYDCYKARMLHNYDIFINNCDVFSLKWSSGIDLDLNEIVQETIEKIDSFFSNNSYPSDDYKIKVVEKNETVIDFVWRFDAENNNKSCFVDSAA